MITMIPANTRHRTNVGLMLGQRRQLDIPLLCFKCYMHLSVTSYIVTCMTFDPDMTRADPAV